MTQREAKLIALKWAATVVRHDGDTGEIDGSMSEKDKEKVRKALNEVADELDARVERLESSS